MPRSGPPTYTYSLPPIYLAIPGTTITAAQHNDPLEDIASTFNSIQPVVWGGTGSGNATGARSNLGAAGLTDSNVFTVSQTIRLADDTAAAGPLMTLDRNSASPAASDVLGEVVFSGRDSGAGTQTYALLGAEIVDPVAATEDGRFLLQTVIAGALATRAYVGAGIYTASAVGGDKGANTINATTYYLNGGAMTPSGFLYGATISNNASDATNDIDFAAGQAIDSTNVSMATLTAMTKQLDSNWAAGTGQGMRYSGAAITNTTYHLYAVWQAGGAAADWYADPSASAATVLGHLQAETGGASYAFVRRVGSIVRTGGSIKAFYQDGNYFWWSTPVADVTAVNPGTSAVTRTLTLPTGITVEAVVLHGLLDVSTAVPSSAGILTSLSGADVSPAPLGVNDVQMTNGGSSVDYNCATRTILTNTSAQIRSRLSKSDSDITESINTFGWIDTRGV